jgi:hypothetical protein
MGALRENAVHADLDEINRRWGGKKLRGLSAVIDPLPRVTGVTGGVTSSNRPESKTCSVKRRVLAGGIAGAIAIERSCGL